MITTILFYYTFIKIDAFKIDTWILMLFESFYFAVLFKMLQLRALFVRTTHITFVLVISLYTNTHTHITRTHAYMNTYYNSHNHDSHNTLDHTI